MADILSFPSQQAQGLTFLDRQLRELLATKGADEELIDFAAKQLTSIYSKLSVSEQYNFEVELPLQLSQQISVQDRDELYQQINGGLDGIRKENHALLVELVAQLVLANVKLFQHERID